jgi:transcriptional regulator
MVILRVSDVYQKCKLAIQKTQPLPLHLDTCFFEISHRMYLRAVHAEFDVRLLRQFIKENPLGILITGLESPNFPTLQCTHIPWVLDVNDDSSETELGRLRGHLARANPHSKALIEATRKQHGSNGVLEQEVTVMFNGPANSYISPKFYIETKPATGKVLPTWAYSAVQGYGKAKVYFDPHNPETDSYLQSQGEALIRQEEIAHNAKMNSESEGVWELSDAPTPYVEMNMKGIIGVEIGIERLEGKWKMSQERTQGDRDGVVEGFRSMGTENGSKMAETVEERAALKEARAAVR